MLAGKNMAGRKRVLLLGKSGRLHAMAAALAESALLAELFILSEVVNPGLENCAKHVEQGDSADPAKVREYALRVKPDFAVIGPEEPLEAGVVDELLKIGIPSVGPLQELARIETSKAFARRLMESHNIAGNPEHRIFSNDTGLRSYLNWLGEFVVKPDGLTGGKGVRVSGEHLRSIDDALCYCDEIFSTGGCVVIEEKLDGEEFTLQAFSDGKTVVNMIPVQDHKRQADGDTGPNTGGMGSYSCADHRLPFLREEDIEAARQINTKVVRALGEAGQPYQGILYGGFMVTGKGLRVIEFNARFGDPEALNVLPLLETDFLEICVAIIDGTLDKLDVRFKHKATVCKYLVPEGYPSDPVKGAPIEIPDIESRDLRLYYGAIEGPRGGLTMTGSRALALVGIADTLEEAESLAEAAVRQIKGPVFHRTDIGTGALVQRRVDHMNSVRETSSMPRERRLAQAM